MLTVTARFNLIHFGTTPMKLTIAKHHKQARPLQSVCRAAIHAHNAKHELDQAIESLNGVATATTIDGLIAMRERIRQFSLLCQAEMFAMASRDHGQDAPTSLGWPCDMSEGEGLARALQACAGLETTPPA